MADPNNAPIQVDANVNYGMAPTSQAQQFITEEQEAGAARGQGNPLSGWKLPPSMAGDFWAVYSMAETFAANTGWKFLPTPQMVEDVIRAGQVNNPQAAFTFFASAMSTTQRAAMPWASLGMSSTQYNQASANLGDSLYALTGKSTFAEAGLGNLEQTALFNGWTQQHIQNYIQQNPALNSKYGYLGYGYNFNTYSAYKTTNATALKQRFGTQFTDANAIQSIADPQTSFHAQGGAFGENAPYVASTQTIATGHQSTIR